jgi:Undecaprenyl-phosphate glucose phosphotransferase
LQGTAAARWIKLAFLGGGSVEKGPAAYAANRQQDIALPMVPARAHAKISIAMSERVERVTFRRPTRMTVGRDQLLSMIEISLDPLALVFSLWGVAWWFGGGLAPQHVILAVFVFSLAFPGPSYLARPIGAMARHIVLSWATIFGLLFAFGYASGYLEYFDRNLLVVWCWLAPSCQLTGHLVLRLVAPFIIEFQGTHRRAIVAGMNEQSLELVRRLGTDPYTRVRVVGFFDDRSDERVDQPRDFPMLGKISQLPGFARDNHIEVIYISLPMASQPRILSLLDGLRDTTASIYFVPDIFVTDLIQGRVDSVSGLPVVAVCETPFTGMAGLLKRTSDIVLATMILILVSPLLLLTAVGVKLSSPGPVIFSQRRYGLDGQEIIVYKFRTMTVSEDGSAVEQARKEDPRITPIGRWLRKLSIDELPQFFNVLQGRMSIVGPRPHAVAHNELYRNLIKGYMLRHKVKPGITGWAQVNGLRGETETVDKMKARIDFDLDYLRNWSLRFDLYIIAKTVWVLFRGQNAY